MRDLPHDTQLSIDLVIPNTSKADIYYPPGSPFRDVWPSQVGWAYVALAPQADPRVVVAKLKPLLDRHFKKPFSLDVPGSDVLTLHLTPFRDVHLAPFGETQAGNRVTIYGFAAIAGLIVLIAAINYMNLATARAITRAREVSLRKVVGATRFQLIIQFLGESLAMALAAMVLALSLVEMLLPAFDRLLGRPVLYDILTGWPLTLGALTIAILVGLFGGLYPAFILSRFPPAANLGTSASGGGSGILRTILVVLQFAISIGLGIAAIVIFAQISYSRQLDIGFDRNNLLVIDDNGSLTPATRESLTQALAAEPSIEGVAQSSDAPFDGNSTVWSITLPRGPSSISARNLNIDPNFIRVYGMKLLAGRNFSRDRATDILINLDQSSNPNANILINAAAARQMGFAPADAVGQYITVKRNEVASRLTIVGVVTDANFDGLQSAMQPFDYYYAPVGMRPISVRIKAGQTRQAVAAIDRIWHRFAPDVAIRRHFEDASFDRLFADDEREGKIFAIFVGVAIFIACLGLFGLAAFSTERRTREIGIRKAFGARTRDIVLMLLWQFSIPVLAANLIAWPVAYYYLHHWLEGYAYRISLSPLYFVGAGTAALAVAWATVIAHAAHVARANPIHALRYE